MALQFASRLSLLAFATMALRGVLDRSDFQATLEAALLLAAVFYGLGLFLGELARRVVEENVQAGFARLQAERQKIESNQPRA